MGWFTFHGRDLKGEEPKPTGKKMLAAVGLISALLLIGLAVAGFSWAKKEVTLVDNGDEQTVTTLKRTVGDLLPSVGVELGSHDKIDPDLETKLDDGLRITITRAVPVTIEVDGEKRDEMTTAQTVAELLREQGVSPGAEDLVRPEPATAVESDLAVKIVRVTTETVTEEVEIPFGVTRETAYNMAKGQTKEKSPGAPGLKKETWLIKKHDGEEVDREPVSSEVIRESRDQVILVGAVETLSRGGHDLRFTKSLTARATAYTHTGRNTATGQPPGPGTVAVDPAVIPLGSRLYIDGYGHGTAMDVGSSIKGDRVDVFFSSRSQALNWGSRWVKVYVLQ